MLKADFFPVHKNLALFLVFLPLELNDSPEQADGPKNPCLPIRSLPKMARQSIKVAHASRQYRDMPLIVALFFPAVFTSFDKEKQWNLPDTNGIRALRVTTVLSYYRY